eukprot:COSAG02_NODE_636_length_19238_cov_10.598046_13_plen_254_part_00
MPKKIRGSAGGGIIPVQCADKAAEEDMQPPQPHWASQKRCEKVVVCGPAHVGKSSLVKNCIVRSAPFAAIYICHGCPSTTEYDLLDYTAFDWDDATPEWWAEQSAKHGGAPLCCVTDDYAYADASKKARSNLYAFVQHCCSHLSIVSFMVAHSWTQLTPRLRRQAGTVFLFNAGLGGQDAVPYIARSLGLSHARLAAALATCESRFSFICMHSDPPAGRPQIHRDCEVAIEDVEPPAKKPGRNVKTQRQPPTR